MNGRPNGMDNRLRRVSFIEKLFPVLLCCVVALFAAAGFHMHKKGKLGSSLMLKSKDRIAAKFIMEEPEKKEMQEIVKPPPQKKEPKKKKKEKKKEEEKKPVDLTEKPEPEKNPEEKPDPPPEKKKPKKVRKIYGLKKVYSKGLGSGKDASNSVVGKVGNTLDKEFDTLTAKKEELTEKKPVSIATVTKYPKLKSRFSGRKPKYTDEMIENRIEGMVKAKVLIDSHGKIKKVVIVKDLGHGSKEAATVYLKKLEFEPALRNDTPIAVWMPFSIRFELLEG